MGTNLSTAIDDHKQHLDMKVGSDNVKKYRLIGKSRQDVTCYAAASNSINFVLDAEHERQNDEACSATLILIKKNFLLVEWQ